MGFWCFLAVLGSEKQTQTKPILVKNKRKKAKMSVNPAVFLEKQGDIREKRRKFELNLKKQTQFSKGLNERMVIYNKGI